jgi:hypothetical protein
VDGFGWNFYGFFLFCILWIAGYFLWARHAAHQGPPRHEAPPRHQAPGAPPAPGTRHPAP